MKKLPFIVLAIMALGFLTAIAKARRGPTEQDVRKADYLYLEALRVKSQGNGDAAFDVCIADIPSSIPEPSMEGEN